MATFNHIGGAEPSTLTFKLATVTQTRNSSLMHQEILSIGDPDSSAAIAAVLNTAPASTAWGIVTREVGSRFNIGSTAADNAVSISGNSTAIQGTNPWVVSPNSTAFVKNMGLAVDSSNALNVKTDASVRHNIGSTAADNAVTISGNSTVIQGTSPWVIGGNSTVIQGTSPWIIGGNSTVAPLAGSTWATRPIQSSAADLQMTATPAAGSTWRTQPGSTLWASSAGFHFDSSGGLQISGSITASASTGPLTVSQLLDSSGGSVAVGDSANSALRVNVVAGAAGGSTIVTVSAFGSGLISSAVQAGGSSALTVRNVWSSTNADQPVSAAQAGAWSVSLAANSSLVQLNAIASGYVSTSVPAAGSSGLNVWMVGGNRLNIGSTAADNAVTATIGTNLQSSVAPSSNSSALMVRTVVDNILTTASTNAFASTSLTIQSSGAGLRSYVTAYTITSTVQAPTTVKFYTGATLLWPICLAALSSAVTGANLAVSAPGYLFRTASADPLTMQVASSVAGFRVAVSYFRAP